MTTGSPKRQVPAARTAPSTGRAAGAWPGTERLRGLRLLSWGFRGGGGRGRHPSAAPGAPLVSPTTAARVQNTAGGAHRLGVSTEGGEHQCIDWILTVASLHPRRLGRQGRDRPGADRRGLGIRDGLAAGAIVNFKLVQHDWETVGESGFGPLPGARDQSEVCRLLDGTLVGVRNVSSSVELNQADDVPATLHFSRLVDGRYALLGGPHGDDIRMRALDIGVVVQPRGVAENCRREDVALGHPHRRGRHAPAHRPRRSRQWQGARPPCIQAPRTCASQPLRCAPRGGSGCGRPGPRPRRFPDPTARAFSQPPRSLSRR